MENMYGMDSSTELLLGHKKHLTQVIGVMDCAMAKVDYIFILEQN